MLQMVSVNKVRGDTQGARFINRLPDLMGRIPPNLMLIEVISRDLSVFSPIESGKRLMNLAPGGRGCCRMQLDTMFSVRAKPAPTNPTREKRTMEPENGKTVNDAIALRIRIVRQSFKVDEAPEVVQDVF